MGFHSSGRGSGNYSGGRINNSGKVSISNNNNDSRNYRW